MADTFPSWRYGPDGQARVFTRADDVPVGWADHPSKVVRVGVKLEPAKVSIEDLEPAVPVEEVETNPEPKPETATKPVKKAKAELTADETQF